MNLVDLTRDDHVRTITLNAPERLNALDRPLLDELAAAISEVSADPDARALVVTGAGRGFCAGADLQGLFGDVTRPTAVLRQVLLDVYASFLGIRDLAIPTVAAVHGPAVGAGLNIALACDVIVAGPRAGFGPTFANIGLHPGGGCTWMLTQRIGAANAAAALFSGEVIGADEALRLGIAQELVDDPQHRARELADLYATRDAGLMADIKTATRIAATSDLATTLDFESWAQASSLAGDDFAAFAARFSAGR
ncbi:enoyl-CoA hydratase/isomerase family protein [Aeromicrobium marinum DSM 15272]|uniref:Enoyl-CoA hydratase/isomerase family protein n=1 Tax=Aeromicrobium marinum DSM 15272 TaxID=585531 RepID=E2SC67_9ACTN|nr:enoyl-CoA hydratase [Aeromicrobium marinum]EFQ83353.1 enoyl-CoA hydratase/isomerase family protein [Aeromicrobium marinum DSM 15272]